MPISRQLITESQDSSLPKKLFKTKEEDLDPQLLNLIVNTHVIETVTIIPPQSITGAGEITAEVMSLTNQDMHDIELKAAQDANNQAFEAYARRKKTLILLKTVKVLHFWGGNSIDFDELDEPQKIAWWDLQNELMFDLYYDKCFKDVRERYRLLLNKARLREDVQQQA